jgi:hypothetical protein
MKTSDGNPQTSGRNDRQLLAIFVYCLSLAFSVLVASLETIRSTNSGFTFEVSGRTVLVFVVAAVVFVPCFKALFHSQQSHIRVAVLILVCAIGVGAFAYPLRFVPTERYSEIIHGLAVAIVALSVIGGILFAMNRFLTADETPSGDVERPPKPS